MQEQQRALKAAQQCDKVSQAKATPMVTAVTFKEKQPGKDVADVRLHICLLSLLMVSFISYVEKVNATC
jgi:hypothetical protein